MRDEMAEMVETLAGGLKAILDSDIPENSVQMMNRMIKHAVELGYTREEAFQIAAAAAQTMGQK